MKIIKMFFKFSLAVIIAALFGCTYYPFCLFGCTNENWYKSMKQGEENECNNQQPLRATENCLERLDKRSYEDYEIERKRTAAKQRIEDAKQ